MEADISFDTVTRKLSDLTPSEVNPRWMTEHDNQELTKSLKKFSLAALPVINKDGTILAGHQRIRILKQIKGDDFEIEVRVPNRKLTKDEAVEYALRDNRNQGRFDFDSLANNFDIDFLIDSGFTEDELLGLYPSDFEQEFDSYDDTNAEMPIVPRFSEKYDTVMIYSDNDMDYLWLQEILKLTQKKCYKSERVGQCKVITVKELQKIIEDMQDE